MARILAVVAALVVWSGIATAEAVYPTTAFTQEEVYLFVSGFVDAYNRCDVGQTIGYFAPEVTMRFTVRTAAGVHTQEPTIGEYRQGMEASCGHGAGVIYDFDRNEVSASVNGATAQVHFMLQAGTARTNWWQGMAEKIQQIQRDFLRRRSTDPTSAVVEMTSQFPQAHRVAVTLRLRKEQGRSMITYFAEDWSYGQPAPVTSPDDSWRQ